MPLHPPPPLTPSAEHGFTLVELMVAMLSSIVVLFTLYAILNFTQNQETRITEVVQSDQTGRTAMSNIVEELHSSCTGITPIREPSGGEPVSPLAKTGPLNLWFISVYGDSSSGEASISSVTEHDINWTKTGTSNTGAKLGTLTDYSFPSESTSKYPEWKFPSPSIAHATVRILAYDVIPIEINGEPVIFQYYEYESSSSGAKLVTLPASSLSEKTAEEVAKVTIGFSQASSSADTRTGRTAPFSDAVVLRLDPTETGSEGPCE
jgi:type II secretory pathway pseudopilin PulG